MSYTKITDYASKDALLSGDPAKVIKGTELGAEFDSLQTNDAQNVKGPASTVDNRLPRYDGITGKLIQSSGITVDDSDNITGATINGTTIPTSKTLLVTTDIGSTVQAYDADLATWSGVTPGANVTTFISTPSSANLAAAVTDETGSGSLVFGTSPTLTSPAINGTVTTTGLTLPALTLSGAITGNSQNVSGLGTLGCGAITTSGIFSSSAVQIKLENATAPVIDAVYSGTSVGNTLGSLRFYGSGSGVTGETTIRGVLGAGVINSANLEFLNNGVVTATLSPTALTTGSGITSLAFSAGNPSLSIGTGALGCGAITSSGQLCTIGSDQSTVKLALGNQSGSYYGFVFQDAGTTGKIRYNSYAAGGSTHGHQFEINGIAQMTLDASGNLLVGSATNTQGSRLLSSLDSYDTFNTHIENVRATNAQYGLRITFSGQDPNNTTSEFIAAYGTTTARFKVYSNGNVANTNNSYGAISDLKLKENITDATPKLDSLNQVRVVNYNLKNDPDHKQLGVIAQELEQIFPGMVEESPDYEEVTKTREVEVPAVLDEFGYEVIPATTKTEEYTERVATGTTTKSVKYSVFVPMLIKAVQELTARVEALEAK